MLNKNHVQNRGGFTAVELLVALGIMSIVLLAINSVFAITKRSAVKTEVAAEVMQNLRISMDFMEQDIRMAGLDRFGMAQAGIELATGQKLRFTADRNMNDTIDIADFLDTTIDEMDLEIITYSYDSGLKELQQCLSENETSESCQTVAENVDGFQFTYWDAGGSELIPPIADLSQIRAVMVSMTIQRPASRFGPVTRSLTKRIICRNLGF